MIAGVGRREEKKAETRAKLLDAAAKVFARRGLAAASLDEIAEEAGLTKGAVYSNFESKEDLVNALLHARLDEPLAAIADRVAAGGTFDQRPEVAEKLFIEVSEEQRDTFLLDLEFAIYRARHPELRERFTGGRDLQAAVAEWMQQDAQARGATLPLPADELAAGLFALGTGIRLAHLTDPDRVPDGLFAKFLRLIMSQEQPS